MYTGVSIKHLIPDRFILQDPASASKSIIKKDILRIPAYNPPPYGAKVQPMTTFKLSSPQDFIDFQNSYFQLTIEGGDANKFITSAGGVHSMFDRIEVRGLGNIQMQEYQQYYLWNAVFDRVYRMDDDYALLDGSAKLFQKPRTIENLGIVNTNSAEFRRSSISAEDSFLLTNSQDGAGDNIYRVTSVDKNLRTVNGNALVDGGSYFHIKTQEDETPFDNNNTATFMFKPKMSFFEMMFPLFLSKAGIEIRFFWASSPVNGVSSHTGNTTSTPIDARCTQFDFFGCFLTPHPDILAEYTDQWQTPEGLIYYLPSVRTQIKTSSSESGDDNMSFQFNVRSASRVLLVCHPRSAFKDDTYYAQINDIYTLGDYNIEEIQARVGAFLYPNERIVNIDRMFEHLRQSNNGKLPISNIQWREGNTYSSSDAEQELNSENFVMCFDFSRYTGVGKEMCGIDLSTVPVDITINRQTTFSLPANDKFEYVAFLEYDAYLKLSSAQISRIE